MQKVNVYILSKDGTYIEQEMLDMLIGVLAKRFEPVNAPELNHVMMKAGFENGMPVKNAHNDPVYLLGEIDESEYPVVVIAWDEADDHPAPRFFVSDYEINSLVDELGKHKDVDAWETAVRVIREIRAKEAQ